MSAIFSFEKHFFSESDFCMITPQLFKPYFENVLKLFAAIEYGKTHLRFFSTLGLETENQIKLVKNKICFDLLIQNVIWMLAFRGCEKFNNSFYFKILNSII